MSKLRYRLSVGILVLVFVFFAAYIIIINSFISNGGYEKNGYVLFVNKSNPEILILHQLYLTGAWDGESTTRLARKDMTTGKTETIDISTIDKSQWVEIKVRGYIWNYSDRGYFSPGRYQEFFTDLHYKGLLQFKLNKLTSFKELKLLETELPKIESHWSAYSDNTFSDNFRAYVFCINGALVLHTLNKDFSLIDNIALMKKDEGMDYTYHLYSNFTDVNQFIVTQVYSTFEPDSNGRPKAGTIDKVSFVKHYEISKKGEIRQTSEEPFGKISVSRSRYSLSLDSSISISLSEFDKQIDSCILLLQSKQIKDISDNQHIQIMKCLNTIFVREFKGGHYDQLNNVSLEKNYTRDITKVYNEWTPNRGLGFYFPKLQMELYGTPRPYAVYHVIK